MDCDTVENALKKSVDPQAYLKRQESFHFCGQYGGQVITGYHDECDGFGGSSY